MKLSNVIRELKLEVVAGYDGDKDIDVESAYIGDLLSVVMAKAESKNIWITIQTHLNIIAVATLVDLSAIIIVEGMDIEEKTIAKANNVKVPVLRTNLGAYELACKLNELGV